MQDDLRAVSTRFADVAPAVDHWSLRLVDERSNQLSVRRDVVQPIRESRDLGAMVTVTHAGGQGYAATSDLSRNGLERAGETAREWALRSAPSAITRFSRGQRTPPTGRYETRVREPWSSRSVPEKLDLLRAQCQALRGGPTANPAIVDWEATLWWTEVVTGLVDSEGARLVQSFCFLVPMMSATANEGSETVTRTFGGNAYARQGGLEILDDVGFEASAERLPEQAMQLLHAPNCPSQRTNLLLAPDQVILQVHESIGHPLELDRILGDERNYAGTSFVTPEMFGSYQYGSPLLNVTFDPTRPEQLASYGWDDEGLASQKQHVIRDGVLVRPLGSASSQERAGMPGVANARATSWNRPPIDRMANLNIEPGDTPFDTLVAGVEQGIYMETNCSWSIDDSRNKFQFSCEWGQLIENGELTQVVKKPGYRGISATFWRNLAGVGDQDEVLGTPFCGKGEPNQVIRVGHAAPHCLFHDVDVFGGE